MSETAVKEQNVKMNIEGMTCSNCSLGISKYLEQKGLRNVSVDFATEEARFSIDQSVELNDIIKGIEGLGYKVVDENQPERKNALSLTLTQKFYICVAFTIPLLSHMFLPFSFLGNPYFQLILCLPVYAIGVWHFGRSALASLKTGVPNMDVLIIMGSSAAFFYSLTGTFMNLGPEFLFYETAATIITLILLGNLIEHKSVQQTTTAIRELSKLQASKAKLIDTGPDGQESITEVAIEQIKKGDLLLVNTGDKVPVDGMIFWGEATIDEAMITGESVPIEKEVNDHVIGGTIVYKGSIKVLANFVGEKTYLATIIDLVKSAQKDKPDIQRLADKVSAYFVPAVLLIALITFLLSFFVFDIKIQQALLSSVAVLVIACPCAMGLATPTAVMVGIGKITKQGILIKGGKTLEQLATIEQIVFDKTGTLTTGKFKIKKIKTLKEKPGLINSILYSMEKHSSHPIAASITEELKNTPVIELTKIDELKGLGMTAQDKEGNSYQIGSYQVARHMTTENQHDIYVIKNQTLIATVDIEDEIKEGAREMIEFLKENNIKPILLSGDNYIKCSHVAKEVGIEHFYFGKMPKEKLELLTQLSRKMPTAMVGDGINDAPALSKADVGISLSNASEVAIDSAQVILLNGNLGHLKKAILLSRKTLTTIKQNLFWAFAYNIIAIPIAAVGLLNPMIAALSMAFSDVMVIGNSIRLKAQKIR